MAELKRSMSSREMMVKAGKELAKSVVVAKTAQVGAQRLGLTALASSVGVAGWAGGLMLARKVNPSYLDPVSANQINRDPEFVMNCHVLLTTKEQIKMQDVVETMNFYVEHFARFRERVVVRQWLWPYWESVDKFDITQHIFFDAAPKNSSTLQDWISRSLTQGANPLLPLWKITIFPDYTFEDGTIGNAAVFRFHHCMGDGFSLARTMFLRDEANVMPAKKERPPPSMHQPGDVGGMMSKFGGAATKLLGMKDDAPSSIKAQKLLKPLDTRIALTKVCRAPVEDIKKAAKQSGFTLNDMVLGALAGALRSYQTEKGVPLVDPLTGVWVALKPLSDAFSHQDIDDIEEPGNRSLGIVYVRLPVSQDYDNKMGRVQAVADEISQLKGSPEPLLAQQFMKMFGLMPTALSNPIWHALSNKISLSVSNIPGPPDNYKFCGVGMESFGVFVPPVGTISTFALITTFKDRVTLSLAVDGHLFDKEDAQMICQKFDDDLLMLSGSNQPSRL